MKTMFNGEWQRNHRNVTEADFIEIKAKLAHKPVNIYGISEELQWSPWTIRKVQSCDDWSNFLSKNEEITSLWREMSAPVDASSLRDTFHKIKNLKMNLLLLDDFIDTEADLDGSSDILIGINETT